MLYQPHSVAMTTAFTERLRRVHARATRPALVGLAPGLPESSSPPSSVPRPQGPSGASGVLAKAQRPGAEGSRWPPQLEGVVSGTDNGTGF
jgi:hypothetical protein